MSKPEDILQRVTDYIAEKQLLQPEDRVLLAVSGGVDSVVMTDILCRLDYVIGVAHCNFKLRGTEADQDASFVKALAQEYKAPFYSTHFDTKTFAKRNGISTQMAARELRYEWLEKIRKQEEYYFIATAHHKNDNIETLLLNLAKGTGIAGLHGILPKKKKIIRPLLCLTKKEIRQYADAKKIQFRLDASNLESDYQRNKLRNEIIPKLEEINPNLVETLSGNIEKFIDTEHIYQKGLERHKKKLIQKRGEALFIPIKHLLQLKGAKTILYEILKEFDFNEKQCEQVFSAVNHSAGNQFFSKSYRLIKDRDFLILTSSEEEEAEVVLLEHLKKATKLKNFALSYHVKPNKNIDFKRNQNIAYLDVGKLEFPLKLRKWKAGDYFYPYGMTVKKSGKTGKKKLSDFFTDLKLSLLEKERAWVLESGKKIAWVVGYRIDNRFKVTDNTEAIVVIKKKER